MYYKYIIFTTRGRRAAQHRVCCAPYGRPDQRRLTTILTDTHTQTQREHPSYAYASIEHADKHKYTICTPAWVMLCVAYRFCASVPARLPRVLALAHTHTHKVVKYSYHYTYCAHVKRVKMRVSALVYLFGARARAHSSAMGSPASCACVSPEIMRAPCWLGPGNLIYGARTARVYNPATERAKYLHLHIV